MQKRIGMQIKPYNKEALFGKCYSGTKNAHGKPQKKIKKIIFNEKGIDKKGGKSYNNEAVRKGRRGKPGGEKT